MMNAKMLRTLWLLLVIMLGSGISIKPVLAISTQQTASTPSVSVLQRIREHGNVLVAGVKYDFPPFGFEDDKGNLTGFDIELIRAIAELWGVEVEFVRLTSADRIPLLAAGEVDIVVASLTHTRAREATIDFSQTYFLDGQGLLVRKDAGFKKFKDLQGKRIAVIQGTTSIQQIDAYARNNEVEIEIASFQDYLSALEALEAGNVEALTTDVSALSSFTQDHPNLVIMGEPFTHEPSTIGVPEAETTLPPELGEQFTREPYAMGVPAGDYLFRNLVNATLQQLKENGDYDAIYRRWFPNAPPYEITVLAGPPLYTFDEAPVELKVPETSLAEKLTGGPVVAGVRDDFPPFSYRADNGTCCIGFYVDLLKELGKRWRNDENAVTFVSVASSESVQRVGEDKADIVAAPVVRTWETEKAIDFSQTYFVNKDGNFTEEPYALGIPNNDQRFSDLVNFTLQEMQQDGTYADLYQKWFPVLSDAVARESWPSQPALVFLPASTSISVTTIVSPTTSLTTTATFTSSSNVIHEPEPTATISPSVVETQPLSVAQSLPDSLPVTGASFHTLSLRQFVFILAGGIAVVLAAVIVTVGSKVNFKRKDTADFLKK